MAEKVPSVLAKPGIVGVQERAQYSGILAQQPQAK
jgi:hypothetical protein